MVTFTIDLWFGYSINPDRRGVRYAICTGASKACDIAESLGDASPPRIVVRDFGRGRDGTSVVVGEFTGTEHEQVDVVIKSISNRLGDSKQLRRAILRVPGGSSQDLR